MVTDSVRGSVDRLVATLGELSAEAEVHAAAARRLAGLLDEGGAPPYAIPAVARELRAAVASLTGAPAPGQGVSEDAFEELLRGSLGEG